MKKFVIFASLMIVFLGGTIYWHYENHRNDMTVSENTVATHTHTTAPILKEVVVEDYGVVQLTERPFVVDLHDGNGRFRPEIWLTQSGVGMHVHYQALDFNNQPISQGEISDNDYLDLGSPAGQKVWKILLTRIDGPASVTCKLHGLRL